MDLVKIAAELPAVDAGYYAERVQFPNGYGVSIVRNKWSYGNAAGKFEVAVLDSDGELDYSTSVTDDVIGWLDPVQVLDVMKQVADLPPAIEA